MAEELRINDDVIIATSEDELKGSVAHLGPVEFAPGSDWIGIKLAESYQGRGKNNGTVKGVFYFDAGGENNGMFVRRTNVRKTEECAKISGLKTPSPRKSFGRSTSSSSDQSAGKTSTSKSLVTNAAAASRENFLRRLEQQQEKGKQDINEESKETNEEDKKVTIPDAKDTPLKRDMSKKQHTKDISESPAERTEYDPKEDGGSLLVAVASAKETTSEAISNHEKSKMPRGNEDEDISAVMSFLSTQSNLTTEQSSLDWVKDVDASSLMFLKGLASGDVAGGSEGRIHPPSDDVDWLKDVDASSMDYLKQLFFSNIANSVGSDCVTDYSLTRQPSTTAFSTERDTQKETEDVLKKIVQATSSPQSLATSTQPAKETITTESTAASQEKLSTLERRMLQMIENQNNQIQQMQTQLNAMNNMMTQMGCDIRYLRESQQHRDQGEGRFVDINRELIQRSPDSIGTNHRVPPPPPPLPPGAAVPPISNNHIQNQEQFNGAAYPRDLPLQRGIFFPLFSYLFQSVVSFVTNFRSIILSTAPGRLYNHIRNEAIRRRALANVDLRGLLKLIVMLAIFSGRLERGGDRAGNRRENYRRAQENNNNNQEEEGAAAILAGLAEAAMAFLRTHRVHVLVIASLIGFLVSSGLMAFLYDVIWVEREELLNVWLGRNDEVEDADESNNAESDAPVEREQRNIDDGQPAAEVVNQGVGREGPQNARNNAPANANHRRGGMIRRGANGGFFHDIYCLVLSFILSLIPAWKPEEAGPPPNDVRELRNAQQGPDQQQQDVRDAAAGEEDGQN